jgi:hypothetical protein
MQCYTLMCVPALPRRELVATADATLVVSLMSLLHSSLDEWRAADAEGAKGQVGAVIPSVCRWCFRSRAQAAVPLGLLRVGGELS